MPLRSCLPTTGGSLEVVPRWPTLRRLASQPKPISGLPASGALPLDSDSSRHRFLPTSQEESVDRAKWHARNQRRWDRSKRCGRHFQNPAAVRLLIRGVDNASNEARTAGLVRLIAVHLPPVTVGLPSSPRRSGSAAQSPARFCFAAGSRLERTGGSVVGDQC
jgi:hypothetical protein